MHPPDLIGGLINGLIYCMIYSLIKQSGRSITISGQKNPDQATKRQSGGLECVFSSNRIQP
jgi:hypothetical protein